MRKMLRSALRSLELGAVFQEQGAGEVGVAAGDDDADRLAEGGSALARPWRRCGLRPAGWR
jgi:hypothetical protein